MVYGIKSISFLSTAGALLLPIAAAGFMPQLTPTHQYDNEGSAYTPNGKVKIQIREIRTEPEGLQGTRPLSVLVLFEPGSGAFSWRVEEAAPDASWRSKEFHDEQAAFVKDGEVVDFRAIGFKLSARAYRGRASSMDDAEVRALKAASESINPLGNIEEGQDIHDVSLVHLGLDFLAPPMSATVTVVAPKVTNVQWDGEHWIVTLQARWVAVVTLDSDYNLVSMKKVK